MPNGCKSKNDKKVTGKRARDVDVTAILHRWGGPGLIAGESHSLLLSVSWRLRQKKADNSSFQRKIWSSVVSRTLRQSPVDILDYDLRSRKKQQQKKAKMRRKDEQHRKRKGVDKKIEDDKQRPIQKTVSSYGHRFETESRIQMVEHKRNIMYNQTFEFYAKPERHLIWYLRPVSASAVMMQAQTHRYKTDKFRRMWRLKSGTRKQSTGAYHWNCNRIESRNRWIWLYPVCKIIGFYRSLLSGQSEIPMNRMSRMT